MLYSTWIKAFCTLQKPVAIAKELVVRPSSAILTSLACDFVSLAPPPLHVVPLFVYSPLHFKSGHTDTEMDLTMYPIVEFRVLTRVRPEVVVKRDSEKVYRCAHWVYTFFFQGHVDEDPNNGNTSKNNRPDAAQEKKEEEKKEEKKEEGAKKGCSGTNSPPVTLTIIEPEKTCTEGSFRPTFYIPSLQSLAGIS